MANGLQKVIYYFSACAPVTLVFAIVWIMQEKTFVVPIIILLVGILLALLFLKSFSYAEKNIAPINIRITDVSPNDNWIVGYIISYLLPIVTVILEEVSLWILLIVALLLLIVIPFINDAAPHPLLLLKKYHFYQVSTENGITYVLISKRKIRNKKEVTVAGRIFEFLLIEK